MQTFSEPQPNPFASVAVDYLRRGLSVIPAAGNDGKRPLIRGYMHFAKRLPTASTVERWMVLFPFANIGVLTGPVSRLTVVDLDQPGLLDDALKNFGDTPLIDESPRGGNRLYYRYANERSANRLQGEAIDVRAGGGCPLLIMPPSRRGESPYRFITGTLEDLAHLPTAKRGSLPLVAATRLGLVPEGRRNDWLFRQCLSAARHCDDIYALLDVARTRNEECTPRLADSEVVKTAKSAWKYQIEGRNWYGNVSNVVTTRTDLLAYADETAALWLLTYLRTCHEGVRRAFAVSPLALGKSIGWFGTQYNKHPSHPSLPPSTLPCPRRGMAKQSFFLVRSRSKFSVSPG